MTLLESVWNEAGTEEEVVESIATKLVKHEIELTGNFRFTQDEQDWHGEKE